MDPSAAAYGINTYIEYEKWLLEQFEVCPTSQKVTSMETKKIRTFFLLWSNVIFKLEIE